MVISNTFFITLGVLFPWTHLEKLPLTLMGGIGAGRGETPTAHKMHLSLDVHQEHFIKPHCCKEARDLVMLGDDAFSTASSNVLMMMASKARPQSGVCV